ncbi:hypothetical protein AB9E13_33555, partial [Rhizobium leguminosarum]
APPCQFAFANAIPKFNEIFILDAGHFDYPGRAAHIRRRALPASGKPEPWRRHGRTPASPCLDADADCTSADIRG